MFSSIYSEVRKLKLTGWNLLLLSDFQLIFDLSGNFCGFSRWFLFYAFTYYGCFLLPKCKSFVYLKIESYRNGQFWATYCWNSNTSTGSYGLQICRKRWLLAGEERYSRTCTKRSLSVAVGICTKETVDWWYRWYFFFCFSTRFRRARISNNSFEVILKCDFFTAFCGW